ncbi:GIY-YIG nuclease family protein [Shewanella sp. UCD-KL12]|uniref:GIY-YIG nuclease family protein n=1 Tax=Shewanella sp. UCD-KL12 TaxID=1917163 RepID=UPI002116C023|nr:GIY-YIG nuclease family protein [Shewanella sp. UCD-KL12]
MSVKGAETLWYLYMIRCHNGHLYTGVTTDISRRLKEHQAGGAKAAKYLRGKGPLALAYSEEVGDRSQALKREIAVKKLTKKQKLLLISSAS